IESSFKHFGEEIIGIIVYNSEKLVNPLTKQANIWKKSCCPNIKVMNEKEIIIFFNNRNKKEVKKIFEYLNPQVEECIFGDVKMKGFKADKLFIYQ
ncbi:10457_t:CDS:1, partial [Gigaspora margarita]